MVCVCGAMRERKREREKEKAAQDLLSSIKSAGPKMCERLTTFVLVLVSQ